MTTRKKTTRKKAPSAKQIAARKKFVAAVKAGKFRKGAKKAKPRKVVKRKASAKKRNSVTVIKKVKKLVVRNPKAKTAKVYELRLFYTRNDQRVVARFDNKKAALAEFTKRVKFSKTGGDNAGFLILEQPGFKRIKIHEPSWMRAEKNPRSSSIKRTLKKAGKAVSAAVRSLRGKKRNAATDWGFAGSAKSVKRDGKKVWTVGRHEFAATGEIKQIAPGIYLDTKRGDIWRKKPAMKVNPKRKRKNAAGFKDESGQFHPIRSGMEQRTVRTRKGKTKKTLVKSRRKYKPKLVGEKRAYAKKKKRNAGRVPPLGPRDGSYIVVRKADNVAVLELFKGDKRIERINLDKYKLIPAGQYLGSLNKSIRKRNSSSSVKSKLENFRGYPARKETPLKFPNGTPANLYRLGHLKRIILHDGTKIDFHGGSVWLCADEKDKMHIGHKAANPGSRLVPPSKSFGRVRQIEYQCRKPHLDDSAQTLYFHKLGEETGIKPTLHSDREGNLLLKGGQYSITRDGIRN